MTTSKSTRLLKILIPSSHVSIPVFDAHGLFVAIAPLVRAVQMLNSRNEFIYFFLVIGP